MVQDYGSAVVLTLANAGTRPGQRRDNAGTTPGVRPFQPIYVLLITNSFSELLRRLR